MKQSFRLAWSATKLVVIAVALASAVVFVPPVSDYFEAYPDKAKRLRDVPGERVITVGGSGVAFGVESSLLTQAVGKPALNMGLHAGMGLDFVLDHVLPGVRRGDLLVVIPEYGTLTDDSIADEGIIAAALLSAPVSYPYWKRSDIGPTARGFTDVALHRTIVDPAIELRRRLVAHPDPRFMRSSFDDRGDIDIPVEAAPRTGPWRMGISSKVGIRVAHLNAFNAEVRERGAHAVFVYPSIPSSVAAANVHSLDEIRRAIDSQLEMPHWGTPEEAVQPDENFFDTPNHPNRPGRVIETARIIRALRALGEL